MQKDPIHRFRSLPAFIVHNGYEFTLQFFLNGSEARLGYLLPGGEIWENPFFENRNQGFLYLVEGIENNKDFYEAIIEVREFLLKNNINRFLEK